MPYIYDLFQNTYCKVRITSETEARLYSTLKNVRVIRIFSSEMWTENSLYNTKILLQTKASQFALKSANTSSIIVGEARYQILCQIYASVGLVSPFFDTTWISI